MNHSQSSDTLPPIPQQATLSEWQSYVQRLVKARGWDRATDLETFLLFMEEVGELAKAFRRHRKLFEENGKPDSSSAERKRELGLEMADVLSYLLDLAQRMDIDLEAAAVEKEEINRKRHWD